MWRLGKINLKYDKEEFKNFSYIRKPLNLKEEQDWNTGNYQGMTFGGELYSGNNYIPSWAKDAGDDIGLTNCGYSFYKMKTNNIIPTHTDHYSVYTKLFNVKIENVYRVIIFLEDWKSGHYFEIEQTPLLGWKAGDYVLWSYEVPHFAANIGIEDRYTLQITGVLK